MEKYEDRYSLLPNYIKSYFKFLTDNDLEKYFATKYEKSDIMNDLRLIKAMLTVERF